LLILKLLPYKGRELQNYINNKSTTEKNYYNALKLSN